MIPSLANHPAQGRVASATTIAVGDESPRNPRMLRNPSAPRSGATDRAIYNVVVPTTRHTRIRELSVGSSFLVTHGYCCFGATRQCIAVSDQLLKMI